MRYRFGEHFWPRHHAAVTSALLLGFAACSGPYRSALPDDANDAIVAAAKQCDKGEPGACQTLALGYFQGAGVAQNLDEAVRMMQVLCVPPVAAADEQFCALSEEVALPSNAPQAAVDAARRCDRDDLSGCVELGDLWWGGLGLPLDREHGSRLFQRSCLAGIAEACLRTEELRLPGDVPTGVRSAANACDRGNDTECATLGDFWVANPRPERPDHGPALLERACRASNHVACATVGRMYWNGDGVAVDRDRAVELLRSACRAGDQAICAISEELLLAEGVTGPPLGAARSCDRGDETGCELLAGAWVNGSAGRVDLGHAATLYGGACTSGRTSACTSLAGLRRQGVGGVAGGAEMVELFQIACDGGDMRACFELGSLYRTGESVQRNALTAYGLWERACTGGLQAACAALPGPTEQRLPELAPERARNLAAQCDANNYAACSELGGMWLQATGLPQSLEEGRRLIVRACFSGHEPACAVVVYPGPCVIEEFGANGALAGTSTLTYDTALLAEFGEIERSAPPASRHAGLPEVPAGAELPELDPRARNVWERAMDANFWAAGTRLSVDETARRVTATDSAGLSSTFSFDTDGRVVRIEEPERTGTNTVSFRWGAGGRLDEVVSNRAGTEARTSFTYDASGRVVAASQIRPTVGARREVSWAYTYEVLGDLAEMVVETVNYDAGGRELSRERLQHRRIYDARGNLMRSDVRNAAREVIEATGYSYSCFPAGS